MPPDRSRELCLKPSETANVCGRDVRLKAGSKGSLACRKETQQVNKASC